LIDPFAKTKIRREDPMQLLPFVEQHLDVFVNCLEEYEAIIVAL
jgi:hypothetical protein